MFLLLAALFAPEARACSCRPLPPVSDAYKQADAVFLGTVVDVTDRRNIVRRGWAQLRSTLGIRSTWLDHLQEEGLAVTFKVDRSWKTVRAERVMVLTARDGAGCGIPFKVGDRYLVYAMLAEGKEYVTGICSRTHNLKHPRGDHVFLTTLPTVGPK